MKQDLNGFEAHDAIDQGKIIYDPAFHSFMWKDTIHDPIGGDTTIVFRHTAKETLVDISPKLSVVKKPLQESTRCYQVYDPNYDRDTLSMKEAYEAMVNGKVVYDIDEPDRLYFMVNFVTPFIKTHTRVFYQDKYNGDPEPTWWYEDSTGIGRYRIRERDDDKE